MKKHQDIDREQLEEWLTEAPGKIVSPKKIAEAEEVLIKYAKAHSVSPPAFLREKVLTKINELQAQAKASTKLHLDNLPMLTEHPNWLDWQAVVEGIEPPSDFENIHLHPLESNDKRDLFVAWVKEMVEEEVHTDLVESFLILEGSCECHICNEKGETKIVQLRQGDAITMQLGETHDIVITSLNPTKAILEWRKVAA